MPGDESEMNESSMLGAVCAVCDEVIVGAACYCNEPDEHRIAHPPMPVDELRLQELRQRLPGDQLARVVRKAMSMPNLCESGHRGPWTVISRHGTSSPHAQCSACGFIDRTGAQALIEED